MLRTPDSFVPLIARQADPDPHTFVFRNNELLVRDSDLSLPDETACMEIGLQYAEFHPVGRLGGRYCRTTWVPMKQLPGAGFSFRNLRALFSAMDEQVVGVAARAAQIAEWARTHRYCGVCAHPLALVSGERCYRCLACGMMAYPRISPAMMVLIKKGDAILLAMHAASPGKKFSPLAGFLEAGESIEGAVHREVFEEVGLTVRNLAYFSSQSWPFPHSLMIAFTAEYAGGVIRVDQTEIAEARWFGPDDALPQTSPVISVSSALINAHRPQRMSMTRSE